MRSRKPEFQQPAKGRAPNRQRVLETLFCAGRLAGAGFSKPPTVASGPRNPGPPPTLRLRPGLVSPKMVSRFVMNQCAGPRHTLPPGMAAVLYRCATTGQNVQV